MELSNIGTALADAGMIDCNKNADKTLFQQELNRLFENRGIIADLRSHLRHLMVTALQSAQVGQKRRNGNSPKAQALNLLVGEYLFRHGCDYTLSVFTSEVPTLANFSPEGRAEPGKRNQRGNCFQENEMDEIFNALALPSREREILRVKEKYLGKRNEFPLVELLLELVVEMLAKLQVQQNFESHIVESERTLSQKWSSRIVDVFLDLKLTPAQMTACEKAIFKYADRVTETEMKRILEEERNSQMGILLEREKRIQEHLKKHEQEIFYRLLEAEKDLERQKETIEEELTEREKKLIQMAVEWNKKHQEILRLSKNFHSIEKENASLQKRIEELEWENEKLKGAEESQKRTIVDLEEELRVLIEKVKEVSETNVSLSQQIQVLIRKENSEGFCANEKSPRTEEIPLLWSRNTHRKKEQEPKVKSKAFTLKSPPLIEWKTSEGGKPHLSSGDAEPNGETSESEDKSSSFEDVILGVRNKLKDLEEETQRINKSYLESKLKWISLDSDSESSVSSSPPLQTEIVAKDTKFSQTEGEDPYTKLKKLQKAKDNFDVSRSVMKSGEISPKKEGLREPTKRQLQNREFFLKSRQLLQELEKENLKNLRKTPSVSSISGDEFSESSRKSPITLRLSKTSSKENLDVAATKTLNTHVKSDVEGLEESRVKSSQMPLRQNILLSESESEKGEAKDKDEEKSSGSNISVEIKSQKDLFW